MPNGYNRLIVSSDVISLLDSPYVALHGGSACCKPSIHRKPQN